MKYRKLPLEVELENLHSAGKVEEANRVKASYLDQLVRNPGFQVVILVLRDLEKQALEALRYNVGDPAIAAARIHTVDLIRRTIEQALPSETPHKIDWYDDETEAFLPED